MTRVEGGGVLLRERLLQAIVLLPLAGVLVVAWGHGLWAGVPIDYRAGVAVLASAAAVLAAVAWYERRGGARWVRWLPVIAWIIPLSGVLVFAGMAMAYAGLLVAAALALGTWFRPQGGSGFSTALLVGLACLAGLVGWLLPFPLHHRAAYLAIAVLLVLLRWRALLALGRQSASGMHAVAAAYPAWTILLAAAATIASLGLWLPSLNYDDNAVHLILPSQLLHDGYYRLDVQTQSWAVAPWANNVLHAIATLFAGEEVRPAVGLLWLLLGMSGAWHLARALDASPSAALAATAVFAAQPLTGYFTTTMQVDGANAAIFLHLAAMAATPVARRPGPIVIGLIAGLLLALKTSNLVYLLPLVAWFCMSQPRGERMRWLGILGAVLLPVATANYAYAWLVTGNPLFPFYNGVFRSPYYPLENFRDLKWMAGVSWRSLWDMTFKTNAYGQFFPGAAGITVLATLPALANDVMRRPEPRWIALWAIGCGLVVFWFMQYLRYVFPALAVLAVLGTVALTRVLGPRLLATAVVALVLADAMLMPTTSWIAQANPWAQLLQQGPRAGGDITRRFIPERALLERIMASEPQACVLMSNPRAPFVGAGHGRGISLHRRYDPELWQARNAAQADPSGEKWRALLARIGASHVIVDLANEPLLARTLAASGHVGLDREGVLETWGAARHDERICSPAFRKERDHSCRLAPVVGCVAPAARQLPAKDGDAK